MPRGLTKRERILIFIAAIVVMVFVAFEFGISPLRELYGERAEELEGLTLEKSLIQMKLGNEQAIKNAHNDAKAGAEMLSQRYPAVMPNEDTDRILTGLCIANGLVPVSLSMDGPHDFYAEQAGGSQQGDAVFAVVLATMNMTGGYDSLKGLIKSVDASDYIRITQMSLQEGRDAGKPPGITVVFEVTMLKDGI